MKLHIFNSASYVTLFSILFYDEVILVLWKEIMGKDEDFIPVC